MKEDHLGRDSGPFQMRRGIKDLLSTTAFEFKSSREWMNADNVPFVHIVSGKIDTCQRARMLRSHSENAMAVIAGKVRGQMPKLGWEISVNKKDIHEE
jgi:hypothetical protein